MMTHTPHDAVSTPQATPTPAHHDTHDTHDTRDDRDDRDGRVVQVVAGVDTHKDTHHVALLNAATGAGLGDMQVPATPDGYDQLHRFAASMGTIILVGIEGTSSYGAGLARALSGAGVEIREIIRPRRAQRRRGKSDPIDAYAAAAQALSQAQDLPRAKPHHATCERIRVLMVQRRSALKARTAAYRQITDLLVTAPDNLRARYTHLSGQALITALTHPTTGASAQNKADNDPEDPQMVSATTAQVLTSLAHRHQALSQEITTIETHLTPLTRQAAPAMMATKGYGTITTATLLITASDNPQRITSQSSFAALCGACPIPASSGKTNRHRLNRGGDRQANWALHQVALVRLATDPQTKDYAQRLRQRGKTSKDIMRCLKRAIARQAYHLLTNPPPTPPTHNLRTMRHQRGLTLTQAAHHLNTHPSRLSELERGKHTNTTLTTKYHQWLTTQPPLQP